MVLENFGTTLVFDGFFFFSPPPCYQHVETGVENDHYESMTAYFTLTLRFRFKGIRIAERIR